MTTVSNDLFRRKKVVPRDSGIPIFTIAMILLTLYMFYQVTAHGLGGALWLKNTSFSPERFDAYRLQLQILSMVNLMFWPTFCTANIWHFLGNAYFLWFFGSLVELRLGNIKYLLLVAFSTCSGWIIQAYFSRFADTNFIGPGLLIASLIGAYFLFLPEKKIVTGGTIGRSTQIFKNEPDPNPADYFVQISPWLLIVVFIVFQVVMHFVLQHHAPPLDNMNVISGCCTFLLGIVITSLLVVVGAPVISASPLKTLAIKHYQQLRSLDIGHEEAIFGTARHLGCTVDKIRDWVDKAHVKSS